MRAHGVDDVVRRGGRGDESDLAELVELERRQAGAQVAVGVFALEVDDGRRGAVGAAGERPERSGRQRRDRTGRGGRNRDERRVVLEPLLEEVRRGPIVEDEVVEILGHRRQRQTPRLRAIEGIGILTVGGRRLPIGDLEPEADGSLFGPVVVVLPTSLTKTRSPHAPGPIASILSPPTVRRRGGRVRADDPADIGAAAAIVEEAAQRIGHVLALGKGAAEMAAVLVEAGDEPRLRAAALGFAEEGGGARRHPLDGARTALDLLDEDARCEIFGHVSLRSERGRRAHAAGFSSADLACLSQPSSLSLSQRCLSAPASSGRSL